MTTVQTTQWSTTGKRNALEVDGFDRGCHAPSEADGSHPQLSVVVPVFDERPALPGLLDEIELACDQLGVSWEVVFVDDGSTDGSEDLLKDWARERRGVRVVPLGRHAGKSVALQTGLAETHGAWIVTLDGDGQDDPASIPNLVAGLIDGFDLVSGWRACRQDTLTRRFASAVFNRVTARAARLDLHDFNSGAKAYRSELAKSLVLSGDRHRFIPVLASQLGWRVGEVRVKHRPRAHGRSKFGLERYHRAAFDLLAVTAVGRHSSRPGHLSSVVALMVASVGVVALGVWLRQLRAGALP
jgi:glycosyltransferase involved in cell wall biosynthesis